MQLEFGVAPGSEGSSKVVIVDLLVLNDLEMLFEKDAR